MPYIKIRRCHISCRLASVHAIRDIIACNSFSSTDGRKFQIHSMIAAYNSNTRDARIYTEFERTREEIVCEHLQNMGAESISIDAFSSEDWVALSKAAFKSVHECGETPGFSLFKSGAEPRASVGSAMSVEHASEEVLDASDNEDGLAPGSTMHDSGRSTGCKRKRVRSSSPSSAGFQGGSVGDRIPNVEMFDVFKKMFEDSRRKSDEVPDLREKVVAQRYELERSADRCNKLQAEVAELHRSKVCLDLLSAPHCADESNLLCRLRLSLS